MSTFPGETDDPYFPGEPRPIPDADDAAQKLADEKSAMRQAGILRLMDQEWFRRWIMEYLVSLNTFGMTFAVSPTGFPDPQATFYHAGMKTAGEVLLAQLDGISPELTALMRREFGS